MIATLKKIIWKSFSSKPIVEKGSAEAYDLWSEDYDIQPGNLMLDLDEEVFPELLNGLSLENKDIADIGCGTGRHWVKIYETKPLSLTGFDVSLGMLERLKKKFRKAFVYQINDNLFLDIPDAAYDIIVSTLTVAHIENIEEALTAWCRILKKDGELIITDFHPDALAIGGKRTFEHHNKPMAVKNFVHPVQKIVEILLKYNFHVVKTVERVVDEKVKKYYAAKNALHVYKQFENSKIIYGIHLKRDMK